MDAISKFKIALIIAALAVLEATALADDPTAPTAEALYIEGQTAYDHADYPTAIAKWQASYELSGESTLLFNLAQAYRLSGDCASALSTYKQFVTIDPTADQRTLALDLARELEPKCGERPTPIVERKTPISVVDRPTHEHDRERPGRTLKVTGLATSGAGIALLASGLLLGHHAATLGDQVTTACVVSCDWTTLKDKDATGRRDATIGYVLDAVGVTAIVGGAVLYYLGDRKDEIHIALSARSGAIVAWGRAW
jgi:tetratricopeptide (TPR) repeat protein